MMKISTINVIACLLVLIYVSFPLYSQNPNLSTEGTDFWFTFLPNYHAEENGRYVRSDSIYIYISSKSSNKGIIYYVDGDQTFTNKSISWSLPNGNSIFKVSLPYSAALRGWHNYHSDKRPYHSETVTKKTFHIVADSNCSVYALDYAEKSAEAFIVLPTQVLGKEYIINTYNSHRAGNSNTATPSHFAIVAPNDSTTITIIPSDGTNGYGLDTQSVTLNRGEVYLVQADIEQNYSDMTGSQVIANKEVAVFAGHQRASIPKELNNNSSRDCLLEQQLPVHTWGKEIIITPFAKTRNLSGRPAIDTLPGIYRVLAVFDNTDIYENGNWVANINRGEFYEGTLKLALISAGNPIAVTSFMPTASNDGWFSYRNPSGDPSMIAIPPIEQYKTNISVMNAQITVGRSNKFTEQYLTLIVPTATQNDVYIDGQVQDPTIFTPVGTTDYAFANVEVKDGQHNISAALPIAVIIYGYGTHVSYGYLGGMTFFDLTTQSKMETSDCFDSATWTYNTLYDSAIASYEIIDKYNCNITEKQYDYLNIVLEIDKIDKQDIAYFSVKVTNIHGGDSTYHTDTMQVYNLAINAPDSIDFGQQQIGTLGRNSINVVNTGTLPISISDTNFRLANNVNFTLGKSNTRHHLLPGDSAIMELFYAPTSIISNRPTALHIDVDTLYVNWQCGQEQPLVLIGTSAEYTSGTVGACSVPIRMIVDTVAIGQALPCIAPSPVTEDSFIYSFVLTTNENVSINIYDVNGNRIEEVVSTFLQSGNYELPIKADNLANGIYFIELKSNTNVYHSKFVVEK